MRVEYKAFLSSLKVGDLVAVCYYNSDRCAMPGFVQEISGDKIVVNMMDYWDEESYVRVFTNGRFGIKSRLFHVLGKDINDTYTLKSGQLLAAFITYNLMFIRHTNECSHLKSKCNCNYANRATAAKLIINETFK